MSVAEEPDDDDPVRHGAAADKAFVDQTLAELRENAEKWEDFLAAQELETFTADLGDIYAMCDLDGQLLDLKMAADVMTSYTYIELQARLNAVFEALRKEAQAEFKRTYGEGSVE
ncbi:DUF2710 family protein [Mycolicibacterium novocastrense]|uniref:DUF2710 family protein n=1 Tax=Mycolicibacterium novocastrense TaxID=59813 RepID=A0AAW5SRZ7_MYCNV|nr:MULTISPECIES: DUF2710 family protein [Mycolicibacterium]MCV7026629.1 DUF2710 family protein [Mycolicibacterium novocastrense]MDX1887501.1 DUF2710 family protein [Mycolicibacterium sp. 120270]GAT07618.1 uncharacterized protein RMCN_0751 [Mycolicibacterium novocastrense]